MTAEASYAFRPNLTPVTWVPDLTGEQYLDTLQRVHAVVQPRTYLEVGVFTGAALQLAKCPSIAVDPMFQIETAGSAGVFADKPMIALYQATSDTFFAQVNPCAVLGAHLDFAFLDGMHQCEFLLRDFANTEKLCHSRSVVAMHDCLPVEVGLTTRVPNIRAEPGNPRAGWWTGDVWRTALLLKRRRPDLRLTVLDASASGLVLVTGLDPLNTSLMDDYDRNVAEMLSWHIEDIGLDALFGELGVQRTADFVTPQQVHGLLWL